MSKNVFCLKFIKNYRDYFFFPYYLLVHPFLLATAEYYKLLIVFHDFFGLVLELLELYFRQLTFEDKFCTN
ncbi:MAG: hypothetical protein IPJ39_19775 [Saprospiraceae bacterium]|nr:hypothetical protein [Saprospiraceae bacterium]